MMLDTALVRSPEKNTDRLLTFPILNANPLLTDAVLCPDVNTAPLDTITDFASGTDKLWFSKAVFAGVGETGSSSGVTINSNEFKNPEIH